MRRWAVGGWIKVKERVPRVPAQPSPDPMCVVCPWAASVSSSVNWGQHWSEVPNSLVFQGQMAKGIGSKFSHFPGLPWQCSW